MEEGGNLLQQGEPVETDLFILRHHENRLEKGIDRFPEPGQIEENGGIIPPGDVRQDRLADLQERLVEIFSSGPESRAGSTAPFWKPRMMLTTRLKAIASG